MHHTIRDAMTEGPTTIELGTPAAEAARIMKTENVGSLPVMEGGKIVGVVTDRDLAIRVLAEGKNVETPVGEIASTDVVTVDPQQSLEEAARLMAEHQLRRLPVCEKDGKLVGILAQADLAQSGQDTLTGETVQQISK